MKLCDKFYVYALVDPKTQENFYIGKGCGDRAWQHERDWKNGKIANRAKHDKIGEIKREGLAVWIDIVADGLTESAALNLERSIIHAIGLENLTNGKGGECGPLEEAKRYQRRRGTYCSLVRETEEFEVCGLSVEQRKRIYWDITGDLTEVIWACEGRQFKMFDRFFKSEEIKDNA